MSLKEGDRFRARLHQASASMLWQLCDDATENRLQPQSGVTPLFSMRTVSLASSQSCCSVDADAWCKRDLNGVVIRSRFHTTCEGVFCGGLYVRMSRTFVAFDMGNCYSLKAHSHGRFFLRATAFLNQIAVLQCEQHHGHPYNPFYAIYKNAVACRKNRILWMGL